MSHIGFQITRKSLTLDDLQGQWQPVWSAILATAGLLAAMLKITVQSFQVFDAS